MARRLWLYARAAAGRAYTIGMVEHTETMRRNLSARDLALVAAVYWFAFAILAGWPQIPAGFPLDDSWIHQVVARNLAQDGTLGFTPGVRSSGSSSLLWTLILAVKWKVFPALSPVLYSAAISALLLVGTGCGLLAMARSDGLSESACWIWALTPALDGNFVWLGAIGMEHLLFATLSVCGVFLWFQGSRRSALASALCLGALSMTRPEGVVLAVLAGLGARWARRSARDVGLLSTVVSVGVMASLSVSYATSRSWLPTTYAGRKWLYFGSDKVPLRAHLLFPISLFRSLLQPWAVHQTHAEYVWNALILALMGLAVWRLIAGHRARTGFLLLWAAVHFAVYMAVLPTRSHGGRYQPLLLMLSFPLTFLGVQVLLRKLSLRLKMPDYAVRGAMVAGCLLCGALSLTAWRRVTSAGVSLIEATHARMGRQLLVTIPGHERVAALDIGRMGYLFGAAGGSLEDMGGLTDAAFLPYMREHRVFAYLRERKIQYLIWPTDENGDLDVPQVLTFTPEESRGLSQMARFCAPHDLWYASYSVTVDAAPCQTLFRLSFSH